MEPTKKTEEADPFDDYEDLMLPEMDGDFKDKDGKTEGAKQ